MKLSLKVKLMISYGLLAMFLAVSLLMISSYMLEHHFQSYVRHKQEDLNKYLIDIIAGEIEKSGIPDQSFLDRLGREALNNGIILKINDSNGKYLYCAGCNNSGSCEKADEMIRDTMQKCYPDWVGEYTEKIQPLVKDGENFGTLILGNYGPFFFNDEDQAFINMVNAIFFAVAVIFLVISFAVGAVLSTQISKPIKFVIDKTKSIENNNYSERIEFISNTKEIDQMIESVNALANTLEMQQKIKKRMAQDYAHEFRTPLAALQSNLEGMIDGIFEPTTERLESCRDEILRLSRMTSDINKLVDIENNNVVLSKECFDFSELLFVSASTFERDIHEKEINFDLQTVPCEICADKDKISQVIINLLSNAVKYTNFGGHILVRAYDLDDFIAFSVKDDGVGISSKDLPHIFEYLYRSDKSRTRETGGSGIGLSVVLAIVTAHGGTIKTKSELNKGSEFIVKLPKK